VADDLFRHVLCQQRVVASVGLALQKFRHRHDGVDLFFFFAAKAVRWMHFVITPKMVSASTIRDRPFQGVQLDAFFEVFKEVGAGCCRQ
jgi:hypothetical protein